MLRRSCSRFLGSLILAAALAAFAVPAFAQECVTGPETACEPSQLCAPDGYAFYYWAPPNGGVQTTRCITAIDDGLYSVRFGSSPETLGEPCLFKFHIEPCVPCAITGKLQICPGEKTQLCGPDGDFTYRWTGPNNFLATTRCVTVGAGLYQLEVSAPNGRKTCTAEVVTKSEGCTFNCPRTAGFWGQQCAQKGNGSTKFSVAQMNQITACVDGKASIFSWGSSSFTRFCQTISTSDMNQRVQAKRQYACFLANLCTDEANLITNNGEEILLDPSTAVTCGGSSTTIGALISSVDARLVQLEGQNLALQSVKDAYSAIITCMDNINNARGIGPSCGQTLVLTGAASEGREEMAASQHGALELAMPYPNPMTHTMRMNFTISGSGSMVKIAVYDLAGRKLRELVSGVHSAGTYQTEWNARDASGSRVRSGVYFVRGTIGSQVITRQVIVN